MIQRVQDVHLLHDAVDIVSELYLVQYFNCNLEVIIMLVHSFEYAAKCANSKNLRLGVDMIVLFEFMNTLLLITLSRLERHAVARCVCLSGFFTLTAGRCRRDAAHFKFVRAILLFKSSYLKIIDLLSQLYISV